MVWVGQNPKDHPVPTPCRAGSPLLNQVAPRLIQPGLERLQGCGKVRFPLDEDFGERLGIWINADKQLDVSARYVPVANTERFLIYETFPG